MDVSVGMYSYGHGQVLAFVSQQVGWVECDPILSQERCEGVWFCRQVGA